MQTFSDAFIASALRVDMGQHISSTHCLNKPVQLHSGTTGPEVIKLLSCSTQLSTKFHQLIKTKILIDKEVPCFKFLRCRIYHTNKC